MKISKKEASTLMKAKINAEIDCTGKSVNVTGSIFGTISLVATLKIKYWKAWECLAKSSMI